MNFNIYLDDDTGARLDRLATKRGQSRNALIREAVSELVARNEQGAWPPIVASFRGVESAPRFERLRDELAEPDSDPLA